MTTVSGSAAVVAGVVIIVLSVAVNILISFDCVALIMDCSADACVHTMSGIVSLSAHILFTVY